MLLCVCGHAYVHVCARMCTCVISGFSILFKIFAKPTKHTILIYLIFRITLCHVRLFVFFLWASDVAQFGACDRVNQSQSYVFTKRGG